MEGGPEGAPQKGAELLKTSKRIHVRVTQTVPVRDTLQPQRFRHGHIREVSRQHLALRNLAHLYNTRIRATTTPARAKTYLVVQLESSPVERCRKHAPWAPAELVSERDILCTLRRGQPATERHETRDALASRVDRVEQLDGRAVVNAWIEPDLVKQQHVRRDGSFTVVSFSRPACRWVVTHLSCSARMAGEM